jgi:hypothetical protein
MKTKHRIAFVLFILTMTVLACGIPSTTPTAVSVSPEFVGLWMSDSETLVFTDASLFRVISNAELGQVNEQFAEVVAFDEVNNHITVRTRSIKVNGQPVGFDAPTYNLTYQINGDALQIGRGSDIDFATELDPVIYLRK